MWRKIVVPAERPQSILSIETVIAAEIDEFDEDELAGAGAGGVEFAGIVDKADDLAGVGPGQPGDERVIHARRAVPPLMPRPVSGCAGGAPSGPAGRQYPQAASLPGRGSVRNTASGRLITRPR